MKLMKIVVTTLAITGILLTSACISNSGTGLIISSPSLTDNEVMPVEFTCNGKNISPEIDWSGAPTKTKSYAMILVDLDAPGGTFTHWLVYDMPISMILLPKHMANLGKIIGGTKQGTNDLGTIGYSGPCPPSGATHRYMFTIYALDTVLDLDPEVNVIRLKDLMEHRILEQASMTVTYTAPVK
jgi:Raf kinase inhibitor-like YbhB/YbcL family protein